MKSGSILITVVMALAVIFSCAGADLPEPEVSLWTGAGTPIHVLKAGDEEQLALRLTNPFSREMRKGVLSWKMTGTRGEDAGAGKINFELRPREEREWKLPCPALFGVYRLQLKEEGGPDPGGIEKEMSFAYLVPAGPTPARAKGFIFGVCAHPQRESAAEQHLSAMAASWCGAKALREDIEWFRMEPEKGKWSFDSFDRVVETFSRYGIEVMPIFSYCTGWAVEKSWKPLKSEYFPRACPDDDSWRNFVATFTARYRHKIRCAEVWNEPDLYMFANFPEGKYVEMLESAYDEVKKHAPEWQVLCGGFACLPGQSGKAGNPKMMPAVIRSGKYDVFAFHGHGLFPAYRNQIDRLPSYGNRKPWFSNETAVSSMIYGEEVQAQTLFRKLIYAWAKEAIGYNWYDLRDDGFDPGNNEHHFGLVTRDFYPKPAYATYNALALNYGGAMFRKAVDLGQELCGFLFTGRGGEILLAAWSDSGNDQTVPILVSGVNGIATVVDLYGNETKLDEKHGTVSFDVGREPATLKIAGQKGEPTILGSPVSPAGRLEIIPGESTRWEFEFVNPELRKRSFRVLLTPPDGLEIENGRRSFSLDSGGKRRIVFKVKAEADFHSFPGCTRMLSMRLDERDYRFETGSVTRLPEHGFPKPADFTLKEASQVSILVPNAPETAPLFWSGPADLSAKVWIGRDGETLLLRTEVTDDYHIQPFTGSDVWRGDNIQLGLKLPEQRGHWELGLTRTDGGKCEVFCWNAPAGFDSAKVVNEIELTVSRDEVAKKNVYEARVPFVAVGLKPEGRFQFNLLVNDNDGNVRESFIAVAPGIGEGKTTSLWPPVEF